MGLKACLDTCVFIAVKNYEQDAPACEEILDTIDEGRIQAVVSTIVVAEVLVGLYQNKEHEEVNKFLNHTLAHYGVQPVSLEIAQKAADIRGQTGLKLPDAIIVATTLQAGADVLITKDIPMSKRVSYRVMSPDQFAQQYLKRTTEG